ncbi:hypothetical protein KUTeg_016228, partial [Tegillarca granosa]
WMFYWNYPQKIPVESVHCVVYDWDYNLTCYWKKPDVKYAVESDIETIVYWSKYCGKKLNMKNHDRFNICKNTQSNYCTLSSKDGIMIDVLDWQLKFEVTNNKTNTKVTSYYTFMEYNCVKPSPVSLFQSQVLNSTCIKLNWEHLRIHRDKFYEISYISKWDNEMKVLNTSTTATAENICNLIPYTKYNFSIGVYPNEESGYRIPDVPPEVTEGSYINNLDHCTSVSKHRNVTLYWKAIPERYMNGKLTGYKLEYYENGQVKSRIIQPQKTSEEIQVDCDYFYILKIKAKTVVGYTKEAATIKVLGFEQQDIKPPKVIPVLEVKSNITGNLKASVNVSWSSAKLVHEVKDSTKTYGVSVRSVSWNRESPDSELVCKKKSAEIRKPYEIAVPIIKTSQYQLKKRVMSLTTALV